MLKNEPFLSFRRFKKGWFFFKVSFYFLLSYFCTLFAQKRTFCYSATFFESLITHKRSIFEESYVSYDKRHKSCTLIVIWDKCLYLTSPTFNWSARSNRLFFYCKQGSTTKTLADISSSQLLLVFILVCQGLCYT